MERINQQELARELNLSQTTVSRSLANHPAINARTKAIVLEAAARRGYTPRIKRGERGRGEGRRPMVCGVVVTIPGQANSPGEIFHQVLRGVSERSSIEESLLDVVFHDPTTEKGTSLLKRVRMARWQGTILIHPLERDLVHEIAHYSACVSIVENYGHELVDSIDVDQSESICHLVNRLQELGHHRIGFLTWTYRLPVPWAMHRFGSYVEALYRGGLEFNPADAINVRSFERLDTDACLQAVLGRIEKGMTALVCAADHQAYHLIAALRKEGVRVPEDLSVTGFDGIPPPAHEKQLTTVRVPYAELGRTAVHQLFRRLEQPSAQRRHILVDGGFIEGATITGKHD